MIAIDSGKADGRLARKQKHMCSKMHLDHFFVDADVRVGVEIGHVEVRTRRSLLLLLLLIVLRNPKPAKITTTAEVVSELT